MGGRVHAISWLVRGALGAGCTTLAGIDKDYVREDALDPGGTGSGGDGASGAIGGEERGAQAPAIRTHEPGHLGARRGRRLRGLDQMRAHAELHR